MPPGVEVALATVPSGKTWLVKDFRFYNAGGGSQSCFLGIQQAGVTGIFDGIAGVGPGQVGQHTGLGMVMPAGATLILVATAGGQLHLYVSGAQLG